MGILAQLSDTPPEWVTVGGGVLSWSFALWYAWYTTTKTIPQMHKRHAESMAVKDNCHEKIVRELVNEFRNESKEQRELERERNHISIEAMKELTRVVDGLRQGITELKR